jgi:hypothetical protein
MNVRVLAKHRLVRLQRQIEASVEVTPALMAETVKAAAFDAGQTQRPEHAPAVHSFVQSKAWTDAALALIACLPKWQLRRICYEDRLWWCALKRTDSLFWAEPEVDESHENMTLAVLKAVVTALIYEIEASRVVPTKSASILD